MSIFDGVPAKFRSYNYKVQVLSLGRVRNYSVVFLGFRNLIQIFVMRCLLLCGFQWRHPQSPKLFILVVR